MTYFEFTKRYPTENDAIDFIVAARFPGGYVCPKCGCVLFSAQSKKQRESV